MSEPDLSPVKPYPGFAAAAEPTPARSPAVAVTQPDIRPADPAAWSRTVPLDHALVVGGERLDAITMRRPTGADIAELLEEDSDELSLPVRLRARICGVHPAVFGALWADDSERVAEAVAPFLPRAVLDLEAALEPAGASA
ncbi:phage tail assembly protein [Bosea sp. BK604]|uniref:phage tail assembly protein n=1 Tax=Bosea sp. BK604 TaxID=2512180 RepID=UPI0010D14075|nr:phage tail assembly protein [Bosea sp. BK604]TCR70532.1 tail assembly chaperone E/41/14-like protein [Bosea sp. BK604]